MTFIDVQQSKMFKLLSVDQLRQIIVMQTHLSQSMLDFDKLISIVVRNARSLINADGAVVEIREGLELVYRAVDGSVSDTSIGLRLPLEGSLSGLCVKEGLTLACSDTELDERVDGALCRKYNIRSMVVTPLKSGSVSVGVLKISSPQPNFFSTDDETLLTFLGNILGSAMVNAKDATTNLQQFKDLADSLPQLAWIANADGWIYWYNMRWYEYTGTTPKQMEGWGWQDVPRSSIPSSCSSKVESRG